MSDFTATDRRAVVDRLLADDYVLEALHHVIFSAPERSEVASPGASGPLGAVSPIGVAAAGVHVPGVPSDDGGSSRGGDETGVVLIFFECAC